MGRRRNRRQKQVLKKRLLYAGAGLAGVGALGTLAALGGKRMQGSSAVVRQSARTTSTPSASALARLKGGTRFHEDYVPAIEKNVRLGARSGRKAKDWKAYVKANRGAYSLRNTNRFSRHGRMAYFRTLVTSPGAMVHVPRSSAGLARVSRPTLSGAQLINRTGTVRTTRYRQGGAIKTKGFNPRMRKPIIKRAIVRPIRRKRFGFFDEGVETVRFNSPLLGEFSPCRY